MPPKKGHSIALLIRRPQMLQLCTQFGNKVNSREFNQGKITGIQKPPDAFLGIVISQSVWKITVTKYDKHFFMLRLKSKFLYISFVCSSHHIALEISVQRSIISKEKRKVINYFKYFTNKYYNNPFV